MLTSFDLFIIKPFLMIFHNKLFFTFQFSSKQEINTPNFCLHDMKMLRLGVDVDARVANGRLVTPVGHSCGSQRWVILWPKHVNSLAGLQRSATIVYPIKSGRNFFEAWPGF